MSTHTLVLCGGLSPERDVSLRSGRRVAEAMKDAGHDVAICDVDAQLLHELDTNPPDCVVPLLHGAAGEDGSLADVLNAMGVPFLGSTPAACRAAFDKSVAKSLVSRWGHNTADYVALPHAMFRELGADHLLRHVLRKLPLPLVVKPARGGSALGVTIVKEAADLPGAMVAAFAYGDVALVERFMVGTEVAVSVIDQGSPQALPPVEIVPDGGLYDYEARYTAGTTEFFTPARLNDEETQACMDLAVAVHASFGFRDYSRTDMMLVDGKPFFLESNVAPGMTETSLFPQAVQAAGLSLGTVFTRLVSERIRR